jgi:hypothetical protein
MSQHQSIIEVYSELCFNWREVAIALKAKKISEDEYSKEDKKLTESLQLLERLAVIQEWDLRPKPKTEIDLDFDT